MKIFSIEEANRLIPSLRSRLESIRGAHARMLFYQEAAKHAAEGAEFGGGGMPNGGDYVSIIVKISSLADELEKLGVQIKDYGRGLIDFPSLRDGRVVLLCWQLGEPDEVRWWHDVDAGFAGRQPL